MEPDADVERDEEDLYATLFRVSREAHALGQHEAAYHALAAAMHAANDARDPRALAAVQQEAAAQIAWIDHHVPHHRLSTTSAGARHNAGVYAMLQQQAGAHLQLLGSGSVGPEVDGSPNPRPGSRRPEG